MLPGNWDNLPPANNTEEFSMHEEHEKDDSGSSVWLIILGIGMPAAIIMCGFLVLKYL